MVSATTGGVSLKKAISQYSPLIDYSAPLLQQTPDPSSNTINQLTLQQQQQLLTQVRHHHRSAGGNLSQSTPPPQIQPQSSSSTALTTTNHLGALHHQNNNNNNSSSITVNNNTSTTLNDCSNNFMNSVVHELNAIKLISNSSATAVTSIAVGQGHPTTATLNINCRSSNGDNSMVFGGMGVGVGDSNNSISILSNNNSCNKPHTNLWGQLSSVNNPTNTTTNNNTLLYNQAAAANISNLWGCSSASSTSSVISNNNNINHCNQTSTNIPASSHPSLSPSSSSSVRSSQYNTAGSHRSNSKESLWTSSQSSPNSNLRDSFYSIKSNASPTSSTTSSAGSTCSSNGGGGTSSGSGTLVSQSTSLWDGALVGSTEVATKLSMDAAATSYASQLNKISNIWEIPNPAANVSSICNPKASQRNSNTTNSCMQSSYLGQSRDLLFNDLWGNADSCSATQNSSDHHQQHTAHPFGVGVGNDSKLQSDTIGSIWRTTPPTSSIGGTTNRNKSTCATIKQQHRPLMGANASFFSNANDTAATAASLSSSAMTSGSSSCMQLFSEEFINYINMIN